MNYQTLPASDLSENVTTRKDVQVCARREVSAHQTQTREFAHVYCSGSIHSCAPSCLLLVVMAANHFCQSKKLSPVHPIINSILGYDNLWKVLSDCLLCSNNASYWKYVIYPQQVGGSVDRVKEEVEVKLQDNKVQKSSLSRAKVVGHLRTSSISSFTDCTKEILLKLIARAEGMYQRIDARGKSL